MKNILDALKDPVVVQAVVPVAKAVVTCERVNCTKTEKLKEKFKGVFCPCHLRELSFLGTFKNFVDHTSREALEKEILARSRELQIRKRPDEKHEFYLRVLQRKLHRLK